METKKIEFFVHGTGRSEVVQADTSETLRAVLIRVGALGDTSGEEVVFVGECEDALGEADEIDGGEDRDKPVDIDLTVGSLDIERHRHVHYHKCRRIAVEVNFGKTKTHRFSPSTTVETVTRWARKKFHVDPATADEYVLQFCDSTKQPRPHQHLSQLVECGNCKLCFDLVQEVNPQG